MESLIGSYIPGKTWLIRNRLTLSILSSWLFFWSYFHLLLCSSFSITTPTSLTHSNSTYLGSSAYIWDCWNSARHGAGRGQEPSDQNYSVPEKDVTDGGTKSSDFTKRILCCKSLLCVLLVLIILCPVLLVCSLFLHQTEQNSYVFIIDQEQGNTHSTHLNIMSAFSLKYNAHHGTGVLKGTIEGKILTINGSSPKCQVLLEEPEFYRKALAADARSFC